MLKLALRGVKFGVDRYWFTLNLRFFRSGMGRLVESGHEDSFRRHRYFRSRLRRLSSA
jgi:hypothetical protein